MREITTKSTSLVTADATPIVLRETRTTRLLFCPILVDNAKSPNAAVKGTFAFERKGKNDKWVPFKTGHLTSLKKGEGISVALKTKEALDLFIGLADLYAIHREHGIPRGKHVFVSAEESLRQLADIKDDDLASLKTLGAEVLGRLLQWAGTQEDLLEIIAKLEALEPTVLTSLALAGGLRVLEAAGAIWDQSQDNSDEEFWQTTLLEHALLLEQLFAFPVMLVQDKAYLGGKALDNTGGKIVDFLVKNRLTANAVLVEIKTPCTKLLSSSEYRGGVFPPSKELAGTVMQVLEYRRCLTERVADLARESGEVLEACEPPCLVVIGRAETELDSTQRVRSFELFRRQFRGVEIVTYDELFARTARLLELIREAAGQAG